MGEASGGKDNNAGRGRGKKNEVPPREEQKDVSGQQSKVHLYNSLF